MKTAEFVRQYDRDNFEDARLYRLSEPVDYEGREVQYVVVSAMRLSLSSAELEALGWAEASLTDVFPADEDGRIIALDSLLYLRGVYDHKAALRAPGYELTDGHIEKGGMKMDKVRGLFYYNFRKQEYEFRYESPDDWRDYIPQSPPALGLYDLLIEYEGYSPREAALEVLRAVAGWEE